MPKTITMKHGHVLTVSDEDYEWACQYYWFPQVWKNRKGEDSIVYATRTTPMVNYKPGKKIYMHRELMGVTDRKLQVDHKDHNGLNNTRENLRVCERTQNLGNARISVRNTSGHKGVTWYKDYGMWMAQISCKGKRTCIGYFKSKEVAAEAYRREAERLFGEYANVEGTTAMEVPTNA